MPIFPCLIGPMPEGKNIVAPTETPEVFEMLTKEMGLSSHPRNVGDGTRAAEQDTAPQKLKRLPDRIVSSSSLGFVRTGALLRRQFHGALSARGGGTRISGIARGQSATTLRESRQTDRRTPAKFLSVGIAGHGPIERPWSSPGLSHESSSSDSAILLGL